MEFDPSHVGYKKIGPGRKHSKYLFKINEAAIYIPVKQGVAM